MSSCAPIGQKRRLFKDAGRACPADYRIAPDAFAGEPELECDVLYVVGGLYGNPFAAEAVDALVESEGDADVKVVLNGDIHWFDKTADNFADIERRIAKHIPLVGNVEAELRRQEDVGVGCGCAYPDCTSDDSVARSNRIHKMLSFALESNPQLKAMLEGRPSTLLASVAGRRVAVTHGDEKLLGGWDNSRESLQDILRQDEVDTFMAENDIDVFTTTHTCAPGRHPLPRGVVVNNGAAGLPNFSGESFGLCIRIAEHPREDSLFECELDGLFVQAVPCATTMTPTWNGSTGCGALHLLRPYRIEAASSRAPRTRYATRFWAASVWARRPAPSCRGAAMSKSSAPVASFVPRTPTCMRRWKDSFTSTTCWTTTAAA